ncbi:MAG: hypothetical protein HC896_12125 [Bacteroidales bacterium]|nr:hypothetical protein [Bacteroidales bacterium]
MDKNTVIGFVLIAGLIIGFSILNKPSEEELQRNQRRLDSIAMVEDQQRTAAQKPAENTGSQQPADNLTENLPADQLEKQFGTFAHAATGNKEFVTLQNELVDLTISNKGAKVYAARLKKYQTYDSLPLMLF